MLFFQFYYYGYFLDYSYSPTKILYILTDCEFIICDAKSIAHIHLGPNKYLKSEQSEDCRREVNTIAFEGNYKVDLERLRTLLVIHIALQSLKTHLSVLKWYSIFLKL